MSPSICARHRRGRLFRLWPPLARQLSRFGFLIRRDGLVHGVKLLLGVLIALRRRKRKPLIRGHVVARYAHACGVKMAKSVLRVRNPLVGGVAPPSHHFTGEGRALAFLNIRQTWRG